MPRARRFWGVAALLFLSLVLTSEGAAQSPAKPKYQPTEIEVKAAFLYHFAQLVTWPEAPEGTDPGSPMVIALIGADPFGDKLEATIGGESVKGHPIKIVRVASLAELQSPPNIVFVGGLDRAALDRSLAAIAKGPILSVSSTPGFAKRGGMIEFRLTPDGRVTFDINAQAASAVGLKMSSQLLKIARIVESER